MIRSFRVPPALAPIFLAPIALAVAALAGAARAEPPQSPPNVAAVFGNTVLSIYPDGRSQKVWLQPDGAWTGLSRKGTLISGHWTLKGEKVCLRQSRPPTLPISFCQALPADMSKEVDTHDVLGTPIHLRLVKGITEAPPSLPASGLPQSGRGSGGR